MIPTRPHAQIQTPFPKNHSYSSGFPSDTFGRGTITKMDYAWMPFAEKKIDMKRIRLYRSNMSKLSFIIKSNGNTPELIASALRNEILQGHLKAKQPLMQDRIAERFGVSKIPVREAMVQLRAEGLIVFLPNRGFVVSELSPAEVDEIYMMRIALETKALEKAIPKLRRSDLMRAATVVEINEEEDERSQWSELNWEFHSTLYQAAELPRLLTTIQVLHNNVARYLLIYLGSMSAQETSQREHKKILQACEKKNTDRAIKLLQEHLSRAADSLSAFLFDNEKNVKNEVI
jgi:DNA-binding GntR family transcriptional regulator